MNLRDESQALAFFTNVTTCTQEQSEQLDQLSDAYLTMVRVIFKNCPDGPERTLALRALKDSRARAVEAVLFV